MPLSKSKTGNTISKKSSTPTLLKKSPATTSTVRSSETYFILPKNCVFKLSPDIPKDFINQMSRMFYEKTKRKLRFFDDAHKTDVGNAFMWYTAEMLGYTKKYNSLKSVGQTHDKGTDIICKIIPLRRTEYVQASIQCKFHSSGTLTARDVDDMYRGRAHSDSIFCILVSTVDHSTDSYQTFKDYYYFDKKHGDGQINSFVITGSDYAILLNEARRNGFPY